LEENLYKIQFCSLGNGEKICSRKGEKLCEREKKEELSSDSVNSIRTQVILLV